MKNFLMKQVLKMQMKKQGVPPEQQEQFLGMVEKNPELFKKIADETKEKVDEGRDQTTAAMEVMQKYQDELRKLRE